MESSQIVVQKSKKAHLKHSGELFSSLVSFKSKEKEMLIFISFNLKISRKFCFIVPIQ